jgi:hypothetical protein
MKLSQRIGWLSMAAGGLMLLLGGGSLPSPFVPFVTDGPRHVVILHETEDNSTAKGLMIAGLRTGDNATYLASKKHRLDILDDPEDERGQKLPLIEHLESLGVAEPAMFILDGDDDPVLYSRTLPPAATAADVMNDLKSHGG